MKNILFFLLIFILILSGCGNKYTNNNDNEEVSSEMDAKVDILSMFHKAGLEDYSETFQRMIKPSIRLITERKSEEKLAIGQTKLGGQPDLPANMEWPY